MLYDTNLRLNVRGDYAVERNASSRYLSKIDPYYGLKQISLAGTTAIDIGANVGTISLGFAALGAHQVIAIEPGPLFDRLLSNISLNRLEDTIKPMQIGIGKKNDVLFWAEDKNNPGNAHLVTSLNQLSFAKTSTLFFETEFLQVEVVSLDKLALDLKINRLDIIKVDVEGMEWEVIQGGQNIISQCRPIVVAETHRVASDMMRYDCMTPMFKFFYDLGYKTYSLSEAGKLTEFIYPNFGTDTFFLPCEKVYLILSLS